ncbi:MAG: SDR family oxidoreductase [Clostridia bacterium]|nr:SDR family oxidoreductase [Clostridia bacterium]
MATYEERVALVTGSGKGVGAGIVKVLCSEGWRCCVHCNSNRTLAEKTVAQIREAGGEAILLQADVSDPAQAKALVEQTVQQWGRLDLLVNNAAMQYNLFIDEYDVERLRKLWNINIGGYWRMIREALPYLRKSPQPRIVNVASVHAKRPTCFDAGYAMTKGGIRMFTRELALELAGDGIPVNAIDLGGTRIEFKTGNPSFHSYRPAETRNPALDGKVRLVMPEEVGHLVSYLASEAASAMTGSCIRLDGGQMLN